MNETEEESLDVAYERLKNHKRPDQTRNESDPAPPWPSWGTVGDTYMLDENGIMVHRETGERYATQLQSYLIESGCEKLGR